MDALACTLDCSTKTHFMQNSGKEKVARFIKKKKKKKKGFYTSERLEERQRVTSRRVGLETKSAGSLRQHKDGRGLGDKAPTLSLPQRRNRGRVKGVKKEYTEREDLKL